MAIILQQSTTYRVVEVHGRHSRVGGNVLLAVALEGLPRVVHRALHDGKVVIVHLQSTKKTERGENLVTHTAIKNERNKVWYVFLDCLISYHKK